MKNNYGTLDDNKLVELFKGGDKRAFDALYDKYFPLLYAHAFGILKNQEQCQDLVQDLFVNFWETKGPAEYRMGFSNYMFAAIKNQVISFIRKQNNRDSLLTRYPIPASPLTGDELMIAKELKAEIEKIIDQMPERVRASYLLNEQREEGESHLEISANHGVSRSTFKNQLAAARKMLKAKLIRLQVFFLA